MSLFNELAMCDRIDKLETTVNHLRETNSVHRDQIYTLLSEQQKQQAAINQLIRISEENVAVFNKIQAVLVQVQAGEI